MGRRNKIPQRGSNWWTVADWQVVASEWRDQYLRSRAKGSELEASRERYAVLYDTAPVGYATMDGNGCIREINLTGARILGRTRKTLLGGTLLALVFRADQRRFLSYLARLRKRPCSLTAEFCFQRPNNPALLSLVSESTLDSSGPRTTIQTVFSDVTEQRRIELELNESRAELAAITASAMDAIVSITEDQKIVHFNAAAELMFCRPAARAVGQSFNTFIPERFRDATQTLLENFAHGSIVIRHLGTFDEIWGRRGDGEEFPIEASLSQTEVRGQKRLTLVMRDISERKQAEQEIRRLNEELERRVQDRTAQLEATNRELQGEVAQRRHLQHQLLEISEREQRRIGQDLHDGLGQQLTGMMLLNDALLKELAQNSRPESAQATRISALLAEARVQVQQLARGLHPVPAAPEGLTTALSQLAQSVSSLHNIECQFECAQPVSIYDTLAATHLFRIAQEAVHNAIRHGHSKRIRLVLTQQNGSIALTVQDDGAGISQKAAATGGLGLQIMKSRCEAIGASLALSALPSHGTRLECRLPVIQRAACNTEGAICKM